jgi:hypothetical protein
LRRKTGAARQGVIDEDFHLMANRSDVYERRPVLGENLARLDLVAVEFSASTSPATFCKGSAKSASS